MLDRNRFSKEERSDRSRVAQLLHDHEVLKGSLVTMTRKCGKAGCHCSEGKKHVSLYLSVKMKDKRRMVYIPAHLEEEVRRHVEAYRKVEGLTQMVSDACLNRVFERKREPKSNG